MDSLRSRCFATAAAIAVTLTLLTPHASAELMRQAQFEQRGDFLLFGNSLAWNCNDDVSNILVGSVDCSTASSGNTVDKGIDLYWLADASQSDTALATSSTLAASARSQAALVLPSGAQVSYARIYWAAYQAAFGSPDDSILFEVPQSAAVTTVTADQCFPVYSYATDGEFWYQCAADVTAELQTAGAGVYAVSGVASVNNLASANDQTALAGWSVVVFYTSPNEPLRSFALFEGLDAVPTQSSYSANLNGFLVPNAAYDAKLGVIAYQGDARNTGDRLLFNGAVLSDAQNPEIDFFNSTRSTLGLAENNVGDLPQLTGAPGSLGSMDLDVIDVTAYMQPGDTSATIQADTTNDRFALGALVTSVSMLRPDFSGATKKVVDLNGGHVRPGDVLEYTVTLQNGGNDESLDTVLKDVLSNLVTYVPGSLMIDTPQAVVLTDAKDDDSGEFDATSRSITVRVTGSENPGAPGVVLPNAGSSIRFRVQVNPDANAQIDNQARLTARGAAGSLSTEYLTDGDESEAGAQPTSVYVYSGCLDDSDCVPPLHCPAYSGGSRSCVVCLTDAHCGAIDSGRICNGKYSSCESGCRINGDGNGCPAGEACVSIGICQKTEPGGSGGSTAISDTSIVTEGGSVAAPTGGARSGGSAPFTSVATTEPLNTGGTPIIAGSTQPLNTGGMPMMASTTGVLNTGGAPIAGSTTEPGNTGGSAGVAAGGSATGGVTLAISSTLGSYTAPQTRHRRVQENPKLDGSGCECRASTGRRSPGHAWLFSVVLLLTSLRVLRHRR